MSEKTLVLNVKSPPKEKPICCLCGKPCSPKDMWVGGYLNYAHRSCADIGHKAVGLYVRYLLTEMWGLQIFAEHVLDTFKKLRGSDCNR